MNPDDLNMSVRKFLKQVGVTSQREIENAIQGALEKGELKGNERLTVNVTLKIDKIDLTHVVEDEITLEKGSD
jgi:ribosomal protein L1